MWLRWQELEDSVKPVALLQRFSVYFVSSRLGLPLIGSPMSSYFYLILILWLNITASSWYKCIFYLRNSFFNNAGQSICIRLEWLWLWVFVYGQASKAILGLNHNIPWQTFIGLVVLSSSISMICWRSDTQAARQNLSFGNCSQWRHWILYLYWMIFLKPFSNKVTAWIHLIKFTHPLSIACRVLP